MAQHIHTHNCGCAEAAKGLGDLYSLYSQVKMDEVVTLNEDTPNSGRAVIKPFATRLDNTATVESSCDGELIFRIPFAAVAKLKAIVVRGADGADRAPAKMKLYVTQNKTPSTIRINTLR